MINDLASLRKHHPDLQRELEAVFGKYGLTLARCAASISPADCRFTITTKFGDKQQQAENDRELFKEYAVLCGVPADAYGQVYLLNGEQFRVVGLQPNKPKNCVKIERVRDGKPFQCPASSLRIRA